MTIIYQVEEKIADDSDYGLLAHLTVSEILAKHPFLKQFEDEMNREMFSLRLAADLWELRITYAYTLPQLNPEYITEQPIEIPF